MPLSNHRPVGSHGTLYIITFSPHYLTAQRLFAVYLWSGLVLSREHQLLEVL